MQENYGNYLKSDHWQNLLDNAIRRNNGARCFICGRTNRLILHHVRYDNLYNEELNRDVYIVCWNCHKQIHFNLFFFKVNNDPNNLIKRMYKLRAWYELTHGHILGYIWYMLLDTS